VYYTNFIDREGELAYLRKMLSSKGLQLVPVWGRRRVGKTTLLIAAIRGKGIYFLATETSAADTVRQFRDEASAQLDDPTLAAIEPEWGKLFAYLGGKGIPIVIDEFPYLISSDPSVPSVFQKIIDTTLQGTDTKLFLCGSSVRMMETHVLDYRAPLYGRRTGQLHLGPMGFAQLRHFFPNHSFDDLARIYGCCGGIPMYLRQFDPARDFWSNVADAFLNPHSILYAEADFLLKEEFSNAATYRAILEHIASGRSQMGDIRTAMSISKSDISPYLANLSALGLVVRDTPVTEDPARSRRGVYRISDNYLKFHFRFVLPGKGMIESGNPSGVLDRVKAGYDQYMGPVMEDIVREAFRAQSSAEGVSWDRIGAWWYGEEELDLVALSAARDEMLCGEVKWSRRPLAVREAKALLEKPELVRWGTDARKTRFLMFSRAGFTDACLDFMSENRITAWTPKDVVRALRG
jgi:hypothetical protein